jgi:membrane protein YqaA with SNARE-associated domain
MQMELVIQVLTVFGLGAVELWVAIPAGFAFQLHPVIVGFTAAIGAMLGVLAVIFLGERLRAWLIQRHGEKKEQGKSGIIHRIWHHYGIIGLGLLAPLLTGAPIGAALGLAFGVPASRVLFWISLGIIVWSIVLTLTGTLGVSGIEALRH